MKKILGLLLALLVCAAVVPALASAETSGTWGDNLTWVLDDGGKLTISGTGEMVSFGYYSSDAWRADKASIKEVVIEDGVTSIGDSAFSGCSKLTSITLPEGLTSIDGGAFYGCSSLTSITLPEGVTSIGSSAFYNCSSLTGITLPDGVTSIGNYAFSGCSSLMSITLPEGLTSIGDNAFYGCSSLTSITLPEGVTSIGYCAFWGCSSLTSITLPDSVTSIDAAAFYNCSAIRYASLDSEAAKALSNVGYSFHVPGMKYGLRYLDPDGLEVSNADEDIETVEIIDGVTSIHDCAFEDCSNLTSITLPDSVTSIGDYAFQECSNLKSITLPDGITSIGEWAFEDCEATLYAKLDSVTAKTLSSEGHSFRVPGTKYSLRYLDTNSLEVHFADYDIETVVIANGVTSIGEHAFMDGYMLIGVTLPNSLTKIGYYAFAFCDKMTGISLPDGVTSIGEYAFRGCSSLAEITLSDSLTSIGDGAFYECSSLTGITLPDSLTSIGEDAIPTTATIRCHRNTYADQWATENGYTVEYIICDEHTTVTDAAVEPTCTETGLTEGSHCSVCGEVLVAQTEVPAKGHSYGEPTYEWSADNKTVTASRSCANDASHVESETVNATEAVTREATRDAEGERTFTATFTNAAFAAQIKTEAIPKLTVDAAVIEAEEKIKALPTTIAITDKTAVEAAKDAYDALTDDQKKLVYSEIESKLTKAESDLKAAEDAAAAEEQKAAEEKAKADQAAADATAAQINALPATIATTDKTAVEAAKAAYDALTADQKKLVDSATQSKLTQAEADLKAAEDKAAAEQKAAEEKAAADKKAADDVIGTISALPESAGVADKDAVAAARAAYDALTDEQKALVNADTLNKLTAAESQITAAEAAEAEAAAQKAAEEAAAQKAAEEAAAQKAAADQAAASAAAETINALPVSAGVADKDAVAAARAAYDALTDEQKALVGAEVAGKLTAAESQVSEAEAAAAVPVGPVPGPHADDTGNYTINADLTATYEGPAKKVSKVKTATIPDEIVVEGVPVKITAIADKAFYKASKLTKVTIGANVKTIGKSAFASCAKLKTVSGGSGVVTIGASAFKGDKALTKITIGKKVTTIGKSAFNGCKKLKTVTIKSTKLKKVGSSAFKGVASSVTFKCPKKQLKAYKKLIKKAGAPSKAKYKK